jgi:hypothetical protein
VTGPAEELVDLVARSQVVGRDQDPGHAASSHSVARHDLGGRRYFAIASSSSIAYDIAIAFT